MAKNSVAKKRLTNKESLKAKEDAISITRLWQIFEYCPETGELRWKEKLSKNTTIGELAGTLNRGYRIVAISGKRYRVHRVIWAMMRGEWPKDEIDHINGDRSDNRMDNLREVSHTNNNRNKRRNKNNISGVVGVTWHSKAQKWMSQIGIDRGVIYLGLFKNFKDAVAARKAAELKFEFHRNHSRE